ncbi:MAG: DUF2235 domain-containing protein [Rhodobacteraceae bacterium]|nr:DUF2235 domain-containing protein [Paracoccaceae bacterium]
MPGRHWQRSRKERNNILRLYKCLKHDINQLVYYEPGVETLSTRPFAKNMFQQPKLVLGMIAGLGLKSNVLRAYAFLDLSQNCATPLTA